MMDLRLFPLAGLLVVVACTNRPPASAPDAGNGPLVCECDDDAGCAACGMGLICNLNGACVSPQYAVDSDAGTVLDQVTGLLWQQSLPPMSCPGDAEGSCPWQETDMYCQGLNLGGLTGWRLPTLAEAFSLVDYVGTPGMVAGIDEQAFPDTRVSLGFWTSTPDGPDTHWVVGYAYENPGGNTRATLSTEAGWIRCVR